jgi:uncharacterized protein
MTSTGRQFWPCDPRPEDVDIADISHHLARICRFNGAVKVPHYSVAQHCILVSQLVAEDLALVGLMHDATEAYCGDMIRPLKQALPSYKAIEDLIWAAIAAKFNLPVDLPPEVKDADNIALVTERRDVMPKAQFLWASSLERYSPAPGIIKPMAAVEAEMAFMMRFNQLTAINQ